MKRRGAVALAGVGLVALAAWLWWGGDRGGSSIPEGSSGETRPGAAGRAGPRSGAPDRLPARLGAIEGTIRDPTGAPIAGAHVCGNASSDELATDDILEPICARTGDDGGYRLLRLLPASYRIDASAPRFRPAQHRDRARGRQELLLGPGEVRREVDLVLQPGGVEVVGVVRDIGGGPIAGAWVQASSRRAGAASLTRTADDGAFRLWFVPGPLRLVALADGYVVGDVTSIAPGRTIEIVLTPESILAGRVVEIGSGAPVAGARVGVPGASAISDEEGRFRLTHLLPGRHKPYATSATGVGKAGESVLVGLGQTVEGVTIELHPAARVTGRVTVAGTGAPCQGTLTLDLLAAGRSRQAPIVDGQTRMDGVLPGTYQVSVDCSGCLRALQADLVVDLSAPPTEQRWIAQPGARIRGVVRDAEGRPVAAAAVTAIHAAMSPASGRRGGARSEPDGSFEIDQLVGGPYSVSAEAPDRPPAGPIAVTVSEAGEATVEIRLPRGGELVGEVVDDGGRPVPGAWVTARGDAAPAPADAVRTLTLDDGSFAFTGVAAGRQIVRVHREAHGTGASASGEGHEPGATATVSVGATARVRIVVPAHRGIIRGRVVDGEGTPITDAFVAAGVGGGVPEAVLGSWRRRPALTDTSGAFAIEELAPGLYTVRAYRRGGGQALAEGVAIGADVTLAIQPTGSIAGAVRTERGVVPERVTVTARDRDTGLVRGESFFRTGGRFAIKDLPPGTFEVLATAPEGDAKAEARVEPGQSVSGLDLVLAGAPSQD